MVQPKTPPLTLRLPPGMLERIDVEAARRGLSRNALVKEAIEQLLARSP